MICPSCKTENPTEAKFCFNCAYKFEDQIEKKEEGTYSKYIPPQLMKKLNESSKFGGMQNERRIVTTLFCDLQGSTAAAEQLDPEEWTDIISGAFDHLIPPVYEYEGILARLMGDAILAFFGAPIAHEDDAERAILAALKILEGIKEFCKKVKKKWGIEIDARIGINTGLVVVGEIGSDMRAEYTAMGDAINIAARMESTAEPGTIQITHETNKRVAYMFDTTKLDPIEVKGKSEPIAVYKVDRRKVKPDAKRGLSGFDLRFIGREYELNQIITVFEQMLHNNGKIIGLWGEAGIGKSRIIREFHNFLRIDNLLDETNPVISWFETASLPYQTTSPYAPFIEIFNNYFSINFEMDSQTKFEIFEENFNLLQIDVVHKPYFAYLLNLEVEGTNNEIPLHIDPNMKQKKIQHAIISFFKTVSEEKPTVLIIDDMHWIDDSSINLLNEMINLPETHKLLLILISRLEGESRIKPITDLLSSKNFDFIEIKLSAFENDESNLLISSLLKIEDLPEKLRNSIIERSQGIPFYLEELLRSLMEKGDIIKDSNSDIWTIKSDIDNIQVPDNLSSLLLTRLDQLNEESKRLAQSASVIGREFLFSVLNCIAGYSLEQPLQTLENQSWIIENNSHPERAYFFKHVLSRDVAYNSLLLKTRRDLHGKIAHCIKNINSQEIGEIGRHLFEAKNYSQALPFILKSAVKAMKSNANSEARQIYEQALEIFSDEFDFETLKEIYVGLGQTSALTGNLAISTNYFSELLVKSKQKDDQEGVVTALNYLASNQVYITRDLERANELLTEAEDIARSINFVEGMVQTIGLRCTLYQSTGQLDKALEWEVSGSKLSKDIKNYGVGLNLRNNMVTTYFLTMKFDDASREATALIEIAAEIGDTYFKSHMYAYIFPGIEFVQANLKKAEEFALTGRKRSIEIDAPFPLHFAVKMLADIYTLQGKYEMALNYYEESEKAIRENPSFGIPVSIIMSRANFQMRIGIEISNKEEFEEEALSFFNVPFGEYWGARSWGDYGYYLLELNRIDEAKMYFKKAINTPTAPIYIFKPENNFGLVRIFLSNNETENALSLLDEVEEYIRSNNLIIYLSELFILRSIAQYLKGDDSSSITSLEKGIGIAVEQGLVDLRWRASFIGQWICEKYNNQDLGNHFKSNGEELYSKVLSEFENEDLKNNFSKKYQDIIKRKAILDII